MHRDTGREQRRHGQTQPIPEGVCDIRDGERDARQEADDAFGGQAQAVRPESADSRERAPGEIFDTEREQRDDEAHDESEVTVEFVLHDFGGGGEQDDRRREQDREDAAEQPGAADHRTAPHSAHDPCRNGSPDFLFERQEHARREDEHEHPQRVQSRVVRFAQPSEGEDLEAVGGDAGDGESGSDREGSFGNHVAGPIDGGREPVRGLRTVVVHDSGAGTFCPAGTWGVDTVSSRALPSADTVGARRCLLRAQCKQ